MDWLLVPISFGNSALAERALKFVQKNPQLSMNACVDVTAEMVTPCMVAFLKQEEGYKQVNAEDPNKSRFAIFVDV